MKSGQYHLRVVITIMAMMFSHQLAYGGDTNGPSDPFDGDGGDDMRFVFFAFPYIGPDGGRQIVRFLGAPACSNLVENLAPVPLDTSGDENFVAYPDDMPAPYMIEPVILSSEGGYFAEDGTYVLDEGFEDNPHRVVDRRALTLGVGAVVGVGWSIAAPVFPAVGAAIFPSRTKKVKTQRMTESHDNARSIKKMKIPKKVKDIEKWNDGDKMSYSSVGSISISALFHVVGLVGGTGIKYSGSWEHEVTKLSENEVKMMITNRKLKGANVKGGLLFLSRAVKGYEKDWEKSLVLNFDLTKSEARYALEQALKGKLNKAYDLSVEKETGEPVNNPEVSGVTHRRTIETRAKNKIKRKYVRFPILVKWKMKNVDAKKYTAKINHEENIKTDLVVSELNKNRYHKHLRNPFKKENFKIFSFKHVTFKKASQGVAAKTYSDDLLIDDTIMDDEKDGIALKMSWHYSNDHASKKTAKKAVKKFMHETGRKEDLAVAFPDRKNLGYVGIDFKILMRKSALNRLVQAIEANPSYLRNHGDELLSDFFYDKNKNLDRMCLNKEDKLDYKCVNKVKAKTGKSLDKISQTLVKVVNGGLTDEAKSELLSESGRKIMENPILFNTLLKSDPKVKATYRVRGEHFVPYERKISY
ncbi:MAG: hypothetical protein HRU09_05135 [Oligoflexales bacterium]|nr:hypothetical protein [Oligoflexales bacterium]